MTFGEDEDVVPESRLQMALQLGEVEVRVAAPILQLPRIVECEESEVEQAGGDGRTVDQEVPFREMPPPGTHQQSRDVVPTAVQSVAVGHETPSSSGPYDPGLGVDWIDHEVPFHRSP